MKGAKNGVIAKLYANSQKSLMYTVCHVVDLCVKPAVKALPMKVGDLLVDVLLFPL